MARQRRPFFVLFVAVFLAALSWRPCGAIIFDLVDRSSERGAPNSVPGTKCVQEEINKGVLVLGDYAAVDGVSKLSVKVGSADGRGGAGRGGRRGPGGALFL